MKHALQCLAWMLCGHQTLILDLLISEEVKDDIDTWVSIFIPVQMLSHITSNMNQYYVALLILYVDRGTYK